MKKIVLILLLLVSTSYSLSFTDEFLQNEKQCKNGDTELCLEIGRKLEAQEKDLIHLEYSQEVFKAWQFYFHACINWSYEGCVGAIRTY